VYIYLTGRTAGIQTHMSQSTIGHTGQIHVCVKWTGSRGSIRATMKRWSWMVETGFDLFVIPGWSIDS
jgi:hypothetical protein